VSADAIIKVLVQYGEQLLKLIAGPRVFFRDRDPNANGAVTAALTFLLFSIVIAFAIRLPFTTLEGGGWGQLPVMLVYYSAMAVTLGCVAWLVMRLFGGKEKVPAHKVAGHVVVFSYFAGFSVIVFSLSTVIAKALIRVRVGERAPEIEAYVHKVLQQRTLLSVPDDAAVGASAEVAYAMVILLFGQIVIAVLLVIFWRVMAEMNDLTALRKYLSFGLFLGAGYAVTVVLGMVQDIAGLAVF
jgi:hypothetical protein